MSEKQTCKKIKIGEGREIFIKRRSDDKLFVLWNKNFKFKVLTNIHFWNHRTIFILAHIKNWEYNGIKSKVLLKLVRQLRRKNRPQIDLNHVINYNTRKFRKCYRFLDIFHCFSCCYVSFRRPKWCSG
jgi:hypothetical protein